MYKQEKVKHQRVAYNDAMVMLDKAIKQSKEYPYTFVEDHAGGSESFINENFVKEFIKKLTRP